MSPETLSRHGPSTGRTSRQALRPCRDSVSGDMVIGERQDFAAVLYALEHVARTSCSVPRDRFLGIRVLGESFRSVIEEIETLSSSSNIKRPVEHLASRIDDADSLRSRLGPADLAVEPALFVVGRLLTNAAFRQRG